MAHQLGAALGQRGKQLHQLTCLEPARDLKPGEVVALEYALTVGDTTGNLIAGIIPCILPERGGRAVPNVEIVSRTTGDTSLLINPAVDRMSQFQKQ